MVKLIEDYGMIGDGETVALVSRGGCIDWLCWPRFDSDACFAALLGTEENGFWRIAPVGPSRSQRRYLPDALVLETEFIGDEGRALVIDFMPIRQGAPVLARIVRGLEGRVRMRCDLSLRFDYGAVRPWIERDGDVVLARIGPDMVVLHAGVPVEINDGCVGGAFAIRAGEEQVFTLQYCNSTDAPPPKVDASRLLSQTQDWWRDWISRFQHRTDYAQEIRRSLIALKAMIYRPTGGIVAAPTTSLPEAPGGERNWDYRYCWLRDATLTLSALLDAGFHEEAFAWRDWLERAVAGDPEKIRIMYRVDGARRLEEWIAHWLPGFRWSGPVRIGNAAASQLQLDVFGEVMDVLHLSLEAGMPPSPQARRLVDELVRHVAKIWREPDQGFWESRGKPRRHVYSKVAAWVAIDRFLKIRRAEHDRLREYVDLRDAMHAEICREGFDEGLGTFVSYYGAQTIDASLLLLPIVGFLAADDPRMAGTIRAIEENLMQDGFVRRSSEQETPAEGAFLACTCWLAECQLRQGRRDEAKATFARVLSCANDLGLISEEYDVTSRRLAGNFPQALTHLAIVRTGLALSGAARQRGSTSPMRPDAS